MDLATTTLKTRTVTSVAELSEKEVQQALKEYVLGRTTASIVHGESARVEVDHNVHSGSATVTITSTEETIE